MEYFGSSEKLTVLVKYSELETCMLLITAMDAPLKPTYLRQKFIANKVAEAFITRGTVHVIMDEDSSFRGPKTPLADAPPALRAKVRGILSFYVPTGIDIGSADIQLLMHR